jgi:hypothetical protein
MKKGKIKHLALLVAMLCLAASLVACARDDGGPFKDAFEAKYEAVLGTTFVMPLRNLSGKAVAYTVTNGGDAIDLYNYSFFVDRAGDYSVKATFVDGSAGTGKFTVTAQDAGAPYLRLSYSYKYVMVGESVELPEVIVSDAADSAPVVTGVLKKGGATVTVAGGAFTADEAGEYEYRVTARDASGNEAEAVGVINAVTDPVVINTAIHWTDPDRFADYVLPVNGGVFSVSEQQKYEGKATFKLEFPDEIASAETCITLRNSLVGDLSEYDYISFYIYNDLNVTKNLSWNWSQSPAHLVTLAKGKWTKILLPISEKLIRDTSLSTTGGNTIIAGSYDWTNLNMQRLYIQAVGADPALTTSGSIYFTDITLLKYNNPTNIIANLSDQMGIYQFYDGNTKGMTVNGQEWFYSTEIKYGTEPGSSEIRVDSTHPDRVRGPYVELRFPAANYTAAGYTTVTFNVYNTFVNTNAAANPTTIILHAYNGSKWVDASALTVLTQTNGEGTPEWQTISFSLPAGDTQVRLMIAVGTGDHPGYPDGSIYFSDLRLS